jgi:hypothetical protein
LDADWVRDPACGAVPLSGSCLAAKRRQVYVSVTAIL